METINRSRRSSASIADSDISEMENEIIQKSGIDIMKNNSPSPKKSELSRQNTPAIKPQSVPIGLSGGNFVSGVEEDLNVAVEEDADELERLMEEKFD